MATLGHINNPSSFGVDFETGTKLQGGGAIIYNTEVFDVSDVAKFKQAVESLRASLTEAGATDVRLFRHVEQPNRVLATMWWPDAESCRKFARDNEQEFESVLAPLMTSMQPEDLWEDA
jgi:hypothetical protein